MIVLLGAAIFLMITGAIAAYAGDRIGSTIGKKRLSVFKMRPRDTARFITSVVGSLIALGAFLFLGLVNHGFFVALERGTELIKTNTHLISENKQLTDSATQTQSALTQALNASQAAKQQLTAINSQLTTAKSEISTANKSLSSVQKKLTSDEQRVQQLEAQAFRLNSENARAEAHLHRTGNQVLARDEGVLIYRSQEEVGRCVISSSQTVDQIKKDIRGFLSSLSRISDDKGGAGAELVKIGLPSNGNSDRNSDGQPSVLAGEEENIEALAQSIHDSQSGKVAVIADAYWNAYAGNPVEVMLHPYADRLAIPAGTELAKRTIPANDRTSSLRVLSDLQGLLETARANASNAGMIPLENPQLKESEIIEVPVAELIQVADQIKISSGPAVVVVTASKDTYSADHPLAIRFTVDGNEVKME